MNPSRRAMLKWTLTGGSAMALSGSLPSLAATAAVSEANPVIVPLVGGSGADEAFLTGLQTGLLGSGAKVSEMVWLPPAKSSAFAQLEQRLASLKGCRLIGLLDEGRQTIVDEILRDLGARMWCAGRHSAGAAPRYGSSHRFTTTPRARGIGAALAEGLSSAAEGFAIYETALGVGAAIGDVPVRLDRAGGWVGMTGEGLARIATNTWVPGAAGQYRRVATSARTTTDHGLVSFAAQL